jgi:hypothetical protein
MVVGDVKPLEQIYFFIINIIQMENMEVVAVLDMSGSMSIIAESTIKSFNSYINELKTVQTKNISFTLYLFNEEVYTIHSR